ncbi:MAG: GDSL family lipase [Deltaproteobacteria bacterium]|nr:GDSL family lipase [Deltaproteobacteria bacterium]
MLKQLATGLAVLELARDTVTAQLRDVINSPRLWEHEIARYERADQRDRPPRGGIVFTGSSTIKFWKTLEVDMAPLPVLNRGFGGAHLAHMCRFAPRIVLPYEPADVVLYCGDNDLGAWTGKDSDTIVRDFERFAEIVHGALPETRIHFVSIKPSRLRRSQWPEQKRTNERIAIIAETHDGVEYVDIAAPMLGAASTPSRDLFAWDGLHLSGAGYALWTSVLRPVLLQASQRGRAPAQPSAAPRSPASPARCGPSPHRPAIRNE